MEKFVEFSVHEYMDMYPHKEVTTIKGESIEEIKENAIEHAKRMTEIYSGGPTSFVKILSREEAAEYLVSEFKKCLLDTVWPDEDNIEDALKVTSENNINLFFDCYGRRSKK